MIQDPPATGIHISYTPRSLKARIVKMVLIEKSVPFQEHRINAYVYEDLKPLASGHIIGDGEVLYEDKDHGVSSQNLREILGEIEEKFPSPPLLPASSDQIDLQDLWIARFEEIPLLELMHESPAPLQSMGLYATQEQRLEKLQKAIATFPEHTAAFEEKIANSRRIMAALKNDIDERDISRRLFGFLEDFNAALVGMDYLSGQTPFIADMIWANTLHALKESGYASMWQGGKYPRVAIFYSKFIARPSFYETSIHYPHSKDDAELVLRGLLHVATSKFKALMGRSGAPESRGQKDKNGK